jgi:flavin reductase (DIM6/NTAB) family NADH-FMN oxidoreductase RutF
MAHFASGVTVITTRYEGDDFGATASAFTSLSLDPPMVLACLFRGAATERAIGRSGRFGINILRDDQGPIAERFAARRRDRFDALDIRYGDLGVPLIEGALAHVECRVAEQVVGGTHTVFLGHATRAVANEGRPLAYYRGAFGHVLLGDDAAAYAALRAQIVSGALASGDELSVPLLCQSLGADEPSIAGTLARLVRERYVARHPDGRYTVRGLDRRAILDMISACRTIEIGVAETTVGWVDDADLRAWEHTAHTACGADLRTSDASSSFMEGMIAFSGNPRLAEHYRELSPVGVGELLRPISAELEAAEVANHVAIVDGYRRGDVQAVVSLINQHARRLRHAWTEVSTEDGK